MVSEKTKKIKIEKIKSVKKKEPEISKKGRYFEAVGRRKTAVARVRLFTPLESRRHKVVVTNKKNSEDDGFLMGFADQKAEIIINEKPYEKYFFTPELAKIATAALRKMKLLNKFFVSAKIKGGGTRGQAEAMRHGISRALIKFNPEFRKKLKKAGYLTRDPRAKERKKFGLKKARRAPQWSKR